MGWRDRRPEPRTTDAVLLKRIDALEARVRSLSQTGPTALQLIDFEDYEDDLDNVDIGEAHINWPGVHREARRYDPAVYFHDNKWRALGSNAAVYEIKVFEDDKPNVVKDRAFVWEIPEDLDGGMVMKAGAFVTTVGGDNVISITNDIGGGSVLESNIVVPAGGRSSKNGTTPQAEYGVEWGTQLAINTLSASGMGLGVWVLVVGAGVGGVLLQGFKGDPGGITDFTGAYSGATAYTPGQVVSNNGSAYVAIAPSTGVEPGVTAGWETVWMLLSESTPVSSLNVGVASDGGGIAIGVKGFKRMPYDGTITEVTLLSQVAGSVVMDVWKTDYAGFPADSGDSITGGNPITLSGATKTTNTALTGWDTSLLEGDILVFNIVSISNINGLNLEMKIERA